MIKTVLPFVFLFLLSSCLTPRQHEAAIVLHELMRDGVLSPEQFEVLLAALNPDTWWQDMLTIAMGLLSGTGAYVATNWRRDRLRSARGEPFGKVEAVEV